MNKKVTGIIMAILIGAVVHLGASFFLDGSTGMTGLVTGVFSSSPEENLVEQENNLTENMEDTDADVVIYWFWGDGCPYCKNQKPMLERIEEEYGEEEVQIKRLEVYHDTGNQELLQQMASAYGINRIGVPITFIGEDYWLGYNEGMDQEIWNKIDACLETGACINPYEKLD